MPNLVLTRRRGERIVIGTGPDAVTVTVLAVDRDRVRLGIAAPAEVPIHRAELLRDTHAGKGTPVPGE